MGSINCEVILEERHKREVDGCRRDTETEGINRNITHKIFLLIDNFF